MRKVIRVVSSRDAFLGNARIRHGRLLRERAAGGQARELTLDGDERMLVTIECAGDTPETAAFSFFARDVRADYPIWLEHVGVVVTAGSDRRSYRAIVSKIRRKAGRTRLQQMHEEPEESFAAAAAATRGLSCPTWLGVTRDTRLFEMQYRDGGLPFNLILPRHHGSLVTPKGAKSPVMLAWVVGRGVGVVRDIHRRLEEGTLPILTARVVDDDVAYDCTHFVTLEQHALREENIAGTHYLVADCRGSGFMQTPEQERVRKELEPAQAKRDAAEQTVLWTRVVAHNEGKAPRYCWFKAPWPAWSGPAHRYSPRTGLGVYESGEVFCIAQMDGKPLPLGEVSRLLAPGESCTFEFRIPHQPISPARAAGLARQKWEKRHAECQRFWQRKLNSAARIHVPEPRIEEMIKAGLLHLDLVGFGEEAGPVIPAIGVYTAIGSESSPIVQFTDSMGRSKLAERMLDFFLAKQHDDGFIQNFGGYMLETGAALWSMGEHWRCTRDAAWLDRRAHALRLAGDYLIAWRERNLKPELRGKGYGMLEGKTADPEDPFHSFMLTGYACLGLKRLAEMLGDDRYAKAADELRQDIRENLAIAMRESPAVPLGDGRWVPTCPPWAEARGPMCLHVEAEECFTHGAFTARDSLLGPLYLILQEVLEPAEPMADWLMEYHCELFHQRNAVFSQPYYSPHPLIHLRRGEVKPFLKAWYNTMAALADRETYSFWEHLYQVSPHKTHEEGWFLMQTRWMLWLEDAGRLSFLPGVPRQWLRPGQRISLRGIRTSFGAADLDVIAGKNELRVSASWDRRRAPKVVEIRLPHPEGRKAVVPARLDYVAERETVRLAGKLGGAAFTLRF